MICKSKGKKGATVADFNDHFITKDVWSDEACVNEGNINFRHLLKIDDETSDDGSFRHSLVVDGFINIFSIKVFALLMCRGVYTDKTKLIYDLLQQEETSNKQLNLVWTSPNLRKFTEMMFFFSEMFPKFFGNYFSSQLDEVEFQSVNNIMSIPKDDNWTEECVKFLDKNFDEYIDQVYEEQVLHKLFGQKNIINYTEFYTAINGSSKATRTTSHFRWIFNTENLRQILLDKFNEDFEKGGFINGE